MGRFLMILLVALGIAAGVAYYNDFPPFGPGTDANDGQTDQTDRATRVKILAELGGVLYAVSAPAQSPIEDQEASAQQIVFHDNHLVPIDKQDVTSPKEGVIKFIGEEVDQDNPLALKGLPTVEVIVRGQKREIAYRRVREGYFVQKNQMVALIDPTKALNDIAFKTAKIKASKAEYFAAVAMANEAQARLERLDQLRKQNRSLVAAEEYSAAVLTRDKHAEERVSKEEQVNLSEIEKDQAIADWRQHEIRCTQEGGGIVKQIFKSMGEGVKNLEPVMVIQNISRLRAEGAVGAQYFDRLRVGMKVVLEPSHEAAPEAVLRAHKGEINGVAVAADGTIVSGSEDHTVCLWRRGLRMPLKELRQTAPVRAVACSPPGSARNLCAAALGDGRVVLWDLAEVARGKLEPAAQLKQGGHTDGVTALAFSPDGKWLASGGQDFQIILWDVADVAKAKLKYRFDPAHGVDNPHEGTITALFFTPQGKLVSAARDNTTRVWALHQKGAKLEDEPERRRGGTVTSPGVSADGRLMVYDQGRTLQLRTVADRQPVSVLESPSGAAQFETVALFSPDGSLLLTAGAPDGRLQLWRTPSRREVKTPDGDVEVQESRAFEVRQFVPRERFGVTCAAFDPKGDFAVSGSSRGDVYVWALPKRKQVEDHRIRVNGDGKPLTLTHVERALDASRIRIGIDVDNPQTVERPSGRVVPRMLPGQRVTVVVEP